MPFDWVDVPRVPVTPWPAVGVVPDATVRAGHTVAHGPVHALCPPWSPPKVYSALPSLVTRIVPKVEFCAVLTVALELPAPDPDPFALELEELEAELDGDELHAAAKTATAATAPRAVEVKGVSRRRARARVRLALGNRGNGPVGASLLFFMGCPFLDGIDRSQPGESTQ